MKKIIALLTLTLSLTAMADTNYTCFGTEPFWDLKIEDDKVIFNGIFNDETTKTEEIISKTQASGTNLDFAFVVKTTTTSSSVITRDCSDGMSENVYSKEIVFSSGDQVLYGCCNEVK